MKHITDLMQQEYNSLLQSGMFWVIFPSMTGNWIDDAPDFIEFYVNNRK
jgi:hypothetical protein